MRWCACAAGVWLCALATLSAADEAATKGEQEVATSGLSTHSNKEWQDESSVNKRAWSNLQSVGWGKRGWQDLNSAWGKRGWQDLNSAWGKRGWQDLNSAWGKRGWQDLNSAWGKRDLQELTDEDKRAWQDLHQPWGKRGWQDLNSAWGKRAWTDMHGPWGKRSPRDLYGDGAGVFPDYVDFEADKRNWHDMSGAWGKRGWQDLNSAWGKRGWQDMSSAWGKRAPGEKWANFHGSWGKRSGHDDYDSVLRSPAHTVTLQQIMNDQPNGSDKEQLAREWSDLHAAWVKRLVKHPYNAGTVPKETVASNGAYYWKREPGWTNLRGMWGKRAASTYIHTTEPNEEEEGSSDEA